jgi:hypothetical protein
LHLLPPVKFVQGYIEPAINSQKPKVKKKQNAYEIASMKHLIFIDDVRNPSGYTQRRLGIQGSVTSGPTRIILLAVCCRVLLRFANSPLLLGECYCYIGL